MSLALTEEHRSLADVARSLLADHGGIDQARATLDTKDEVLPAFWAPFKENGMFGLHLPEEFGGQGFGLEETAIVVEELGRVVAPGAFLPTVVVSATIAAAGTQAQKQALLPGFAEGDSTSGFSLHNTITVSGGKASGTANAVTSAELATHLAFVVGNDLVIVPASSATITPNKTIDESRRNAKVELKDAPAEIIVGGGELAHRIGRVLAAAEAAGGARPVSHVIPANAGIHRGLARQCASGPRLSPG